MGFGIYSQTNIFAVEAVVAEESDVAYDSPPAAAPQVENRISGASIPEKPKVALRNYFPENWLFELINVSKETLKRCNL